MFGRTTLTQERSPQKPLLNRSKIQIDTDLHKPLLTGIAEAQKRLSEKNWAALGSYLQFPILCEI